MGKITIDELSTELKEYINGLGLTEEQVNELIQNVTGDMNTLQTTEKTVAGAINELFQNANNGKELIATAIGEPLVSTDTFSAMSNNINNLLGAFRTNMMNNGVMVEGTDKFKQLIDKIKGLTEGEGNKGIQFAEGTCTVTNSLITHNCGFIPTYFFVLANGISLQYKLSNGSFYNSVLYNPIISNIRMFGSDASTGIVGSSSITELNESTVKISNISGDVTWYAIGVGEEDTTFRDSLASILENKGVSVTPEDDMASLITKVDSMRFVGPNERLISNYYYPFEITRTYTTITNMDYTIKDNIIYYFVEGAPGSSTSDREAYIYKYNMDNKTVVKSLKVDNSSSYTSEAIFLEDSILIFSYKSATLYSYDDFSQIKTTAFGGTLCAKSKFLKYENYIYGLVSDGFVFKFDINEFTTVKSATMRSDYQMNEPRVLIIDNGFIYAGSAYSGTGNGPYYKYDMDLTLQTNTGTVTVVNGGFIMNGYIYSLSPAFNGGTKPIVSIYRIDMKTSNNGLEPIKNLVNLSSMFTPSLSQNLKWGYFIVNDDIFITYSNVIAKFSKNDIETFTTDTPTYFCIPSNGENIDNIALSGDCYEITTIGQRGVSIFKSSDFC